MVGSWRQYIDFITIMFSFRVTMNATNCTYMNCSTTIKKKLVMSYKDSRDVDCT